MPALAARRRVLALIAVLGAGATMLAASPAALAVQVVRRGLFTFMTKG